MLASRSGGLVSLKIYDLLGKVVATLVDEKLSPGAYEVKFDGSSLTSGFIFIKFKAGEFTDTKEDDAGEVKIHSWINFLCLKI